MADKIKKPTLSKPTRITSGKYEIDIFKLPPRNRGSNVYEYGTRVKDTETDSFVGNLSINGTSNWKYVENTVNRAVEEELPLQQEELVVHLKVELNEKAS